MSSAYITFVVRFSSVKKNSPDTLSISWMKNSNNTLNNAGGNKHPCLKPTSTAFSVFIQIVGSVDDPFTNNNKSNYFPHSVSPHCAKSGFEVNKVNKVEVSSRTMFLCFF